MADAGSAPLMEALKVLRRIEERERANVEDVSRLCKALESLDPARAADDEPMFRVIKGRAQEGPQ